MLRNPTRSNREAKEATPIASRLTLRSGVRVFLTPAFTSSLIANTASADRSVGRSAWATASALDRSRAGCFGCDRDGGALHVIRMSPIDSTMLRQDQLG